MKRGGTGNGVTEAEWKRKKGMELLASGMKQIRVARKLGVNRRTVYEWKRRLDNNRDFRNGKKSGRPSRLSEEQKSLLKKIIDNGAANYGFPTDVWTLKRIAEVIEREFSVHYNTTYIWQILDSMGYSAQIPLLSAVEKNEKYVQEWLENDYPEYVREAREMSATILFEDESGMQSRPNVRRTWSPRGKRPVMRVKEKRDKISISSAVTEEGHLYFMIAKESMNEDHTIMFLEQLLSEINGFLYIFWDSITIHRSLKVKEFLGKHNDRLITRRIPSYSPELNPDEYVWDDLKYQRLYNFCPRSYDELYGKAMETLLSMKADPGKVKQVIRGTKLPLPSTVGT